MKEQIKAANTAIMTLAGYSLVLFIFSISPTIDTKYLNAVEELKTVKKLPIGGYSNTSFQNYVVDAIKPRIQAIKNTIYESFRSNGFPIDSSKHPGLSHFFEIDYAFMPFMHYEEQPKFSNINVLYNEVQENIRLPIKLSNANSLAEFLNRFLTDYRKDIDTLTAFNLVYNNVAGGRIEIDGIVQESIKDKFANIFF